MDEHTSHVDDVFRLLTSQYVHILAVTRGRCTGNFIEITPAPSLLGRSEQAALDLDDSGISHRHCIVSLADGEALVSDLGSSNGTWIDGVRMEEDRSLPVGSRMQIGNTLLCHELRSREDLQLEQRRREELDRAVSYVQSLLPQRIRLGKVRSDWSFVPSARLNGDAFGYHYINEDCFAVYFLDVCGHGQDAALHSVSLLNVLRRHGMPGIDFTQPDEVLASLNQAFPMDAHGNMYFTIWYGLYRPASRTLTWSSAGHPPALLVPALGGRGRPLKMESFPAGMIEDACYRSTDVSVPPGSHLFLYSDGAFDFVTKEGPRFSHPELLDLLGSTMGAGSGEVQRVERELRTRLAADAFEDDFSLLMLEFD